LTIISQFRSAVSDNTALRAAMLLWISAITAILYRPVVTILISHDLQIGEQLLGNPTVTTLGIVRFADCSKKRKLARMCDG
jgi:hypothetical protein